MKPGLIVLCILFPFVRCVENNHTAPTDQVHMYVNKGIDSLSDWLAEDFITAIEISDDSLEIRNSFSRGRKLYKKIEFAIEYFFPNTARSLNGPPLPEIEPEEHIIVEPGGFQVMEEFLFPFNVDGRLHLIREARRMKSMLVRASQLWAGHQFRDDQVFDAIRMQCFRMITLGITGFDTPVSMTALDELRVSLQTIHDVLNYYPNERSDRLTEIIQIAQSKTDHANFETFDRLNFITQCVNPLTTELLEQQENLSIPILDNVYALRGNIHTLFDSSAFDIDYFAPDAGSFLTSNKVELGRKLFYEPLLSGNNKISCASCHNPAKSFTDGLTTSKALAGNGDLARNTPTLINAGLQRAQFYDMRASFLEDQVKNVIESKDEMHGSLQSALVKLNRDTAYIDVFKRAFPEADQGITERQIQVALACYIRSLTSFNSRFDQFMRGDYSKMNAEEKMGFNLFMGKAKCGTCHFMPIFNGTVPPSFMFTESEVIGVPKRKSETYISDDLGRYGIYKIENFKHAFKTPGVRNIEMTAPYMHNGIFKTLEEVVDFYDKGGGTGLGLKVPNQTLPTDPLKLTDYEKLSLVAFMKTLSDSSIMNK